MKYIAILLLAFLSGCSGLSVNWDFYANYRSTTLSQEKAK